MTAYERRSYPGGAVATTITADCLIGATLFTLSDSSGWVGTNPITAMLDYDTSAAEKVYGTVSGTVFTITQRGYDSTSEVDHKAGAKVRVVWDATDADEMNNLVHQTLGAVTAKGDILSGSGANTLTKTAVGADGTLLVASSTTSGGVKWAQDGIVLTAQADATKPLVVKAHSATQSANLFQADDSTGAAVAAVDSAGRLAAYQGLYVRGAQAGLQVQIDNTAGAATNVPLSIDLHASQSANAFAVYNSGLVLLAGISNSGQILGYHGLSIAGGDPGYASYITADMHADANPAIFGLLVKGASGQTADLIRLESSAGTTLAAVTATGQLWQGQTATPGAPSSGGYLYVNASNQLRFRSPSGDFLVAG